MTDPIKALVAKWRAEADQHDMNALEADSVGLVDAAECGRLMALVKIQLADELESLTAVAGDAEPANLGEFVIALLIAGGYVTQAKVDEARKIAISHGPYEMPARQAVEGMVLVPKEPTDSMKDAMAKACGGCTFGYHDRETGVYETDREMAEEIYRAMLAAAPQAGKGEVR